MGKGGNYRNPRCGKADTAQDIHTDCRLQAIEAVRESKVMQSRAVRFGRYPNRGMGSSGNDDLGSFSVNSNRGMNRRFPGIDEGNIDTHGHVLFSYEEIEGYDATGQNVDSDDVDRILDFMDQAGLARMWVSGMWGSDLGNPDLSAEVQALLEEYGTKAAFEAMRDTLLHEASQLSIPDGESEPRLVPFVSGFLLDSEDALEHVCGWLAAGFAGVGELIVHGHTSSFDGTSDIMQQIYQAAAQYGVPVLVHWDIGGIEYDQEFCDSCEDGVCDTEGFIEYARTKRQENLEELRAALEANPETMFILAHCGSGPGDISEDPCNRGTILDNGSQLDAVTSGEYAAALEQLALSYENLWFDISGTPTEIQEVQAIVQDVMIQRPDRFLFGYDLDDEQLRTADRQWLIDLYSDFLSPMVKLGIDHLVRSENAAYIALQRTTPTDGPCDVDEDEEEEEIWGWEPWGAIPLRWFDRFDDSKKLEPFGPDDFIASTW
jgi:predicted TIM-barrel fold metal-dependent hydrolase